MLRTSRGRGVPLAGLLASGFLAAAGIAPGAAPEPDGTIALTFPANEPTSLSQVLVDRP